MNELDLIKLNIFEAYDNGEITYGEKEYLLEQVDYMYEADAFTKRMRQYKKDSKHSNPYIAKYADDKASALSDQMVRRGRSDAYLPKKTSIRNRDWAQKVKNNLGNVYNNDTASDKSFVKQREYDKNKRLYADKLANKEAGTILAKQEKMRKDKAEAIKYFTKQGMSPDEAKKYLNIKESTFDTLLESINDLYYED